MNPRWNLYGSFLSIVISVLFIGLAAEYFPSDLWFYGTFAGLLASMFAVTFFADYKESVYDMLR
jgi:hypothetical protein